MCGFAGIKNFNSNFNPDYISKDILNSITHRGPDFQNYWYNNNLKTALYHTRLSIIDESINGNQPMFSSDKSMIIAYNGEVYNFLEIKKDLQNKGIKFKSNSDTEVILESISYYGIFNTAKKLDGMFSLCLFDINKNKLFLVRDSVGIKPLYWGKQNNILIFASELKSISKFKQFNLNIDNQIIQSYLKYGYIPTPYSIFKDIYKLKPGTILEFDSNNNIKISNYDSEFIKSKFYNEDNFVETANDVNIILNQSVKNTMISDVKIGSMLSSGVDSSLITALMQQNSTSKINSFTAGFEFDSFDESKNAKRIANYIGTNHQEIIIENSNIKDMFFSAIDCYDEPFADSSQIPTYLISKYIKNSVKVVLSGDGGDEIFGGYNRYLWASKFLKLNNKLHPKLIKLISFILSQISKYNLEYLSGIVPTRYKFNQLSNKLFKISRIIKLNEIDKIYDSLISQTFEQSKYLNFNYPTYVHEAYSNFDNEIIKSMQNIDFTTYLPDDILTKVDRASMANGLEVRVPYLNKAIVSLRNSLPEKYKINNSGGKIILKKILQQYLPKELVNQPKKGFAIPLQHWLQSYFKEHVSDTLSRENTRKLGFMNSDNIENTLSTFYKGDGNIALQNDIWTLFTLVNWLNKNT
jgi:asparagine synthase (glutamine-hydrolysing)